MTDNQMWAEYYKYLYQIVCGGDENLKNISWSMLIGHLFIVPFRYSYISMDGNRLEDGLNLRDRFADYAGYPPAQVESLLNRYECSVLEVMIALALRMEEETMASTEFGDRTSQWFWYMIISLGLSGMTDDHYDSDYVDDRINAFLDREYAPDGQGSLFWVPGTKKDFRNIEIWYQMCEYLNSTINEGRT